MISDFAGFFFYLYNDILCSQQDNSLLRWLIAYIWPVTRQALACLVQWLQTNSIKFCHIYFIKALIQERKNLSYDCITKTILVLLFSFCDLPKILKIAKL